MDTGKPTIVFFGNERLATGVSTTAPTLQALLQAGYNIAAVVSHYEKSRSRNARGLEIAVVAAEHGIPLLLPAKPREILDQLQDYQAAIGVLVAYGKIVPQAVIDAFPGGIVNIHPSLLPQHRGPIPIESVILEGAHETGISVMKLVKDMDAGPVYAQTRLSLRGDESKQELADRLLEQGKVALLEALPAIIDGSLQPLPQDDAAATYDSLILKDAGTLEPSKPATQLEREVRAYAEWPKSRIMLGSTPLVVTKAHTLDENRHEIGTIWLDSNEKPKQLGLQTSHGVLVFDEVKPAGKAAMNSQAFLAGYRQLLA